jgi:Ca2+-binding RTX toxin-like protein
MVSKNGTSGNDLINGTDQADVLNGMAGNDRLYGYGGNDVLFGGTGADHMVGNLGNDEYYVDNVHDSVIEHPNEGIDRITASISFSLVATGPGSPLEVEELILGGTANINGTGNALDNYIVGNSGKNELRGGRGHDRLLGGANEDILIGGDGNDILTGGAGHDKLTGGAGADRFYFTEPTDGVDQITDFNRHQGDKILLSSETFAVRVFTPRSANLSDPISLDSRLFHLGSEAQNSNHRLIYDQSNGKLFYDADGKGGMAKVLLAKFDNNPSLSAGDFAYVVI